MIRSNRRISHWLNWDQLLSRECGGFWPASPAAIQGAKNSAHYAMQRGSQWCRCLGSPEPNQLSTCLREF